MSRGREIYPEVHTCESANLCWSGAETKVPERYQVAH